MWDREISPLGLEFQPGTRQTSSLEEIPTPGVILSMNNAWISKQFGTVVSLEEEKCHLTQLKVKLTRVI